MRDLSYAYQFRHCVLFSLFCYTYIYLSALKRHVLRAVTSADPLQTHYSSDRGILFISTRCLDLSIGTGAGALTAVGAAMRTRHELSAELRAIR